MNSLWRLFGTTLSLCSALLLGTAWGDDATPAATLDSAAVAGLAAQDGDARIVAIEALGALASPAAYVLLHALMDEKAYTTPDARVLIVGDDGVAFDPVTGTRGPAPDGIDSITINNRMRGALEAALAGERLFAKEHDARLAAAAEIAREPRLSQKPLLERALAAEHEPDVHAELAIGLAKVDLQSTDPATRRLALNSLALTGNEETRGLIAAMLQKQADGSTLEPDAEVRAAANDALRQIDQRLTRVEWLGNLFYGVSLASVLLLAALGLAITFGLMGIINMAHGEMLMIGAYATYVMQLLFRRYAPGLIDWYVIAAIPFAFAVAALVGMALERGVIRWLYGRPLETLLATWGISLFLMQSVRTLFGAQNVEVGNPAWMSGGVTVLGGLVLAYNRLVIIVFALLVLFLVWVLLNRTRLGLFVRAVTQNRHMADCIGVPTGRIDMLTFGLGSGIAGLGGVALSQLGNVGPDLGQGYLVDSFMVVVLGGVGQLAGTIIAAFGLGELNKMLEPYAGAVLGKIAILVLIVLFVQKRPQGLFALRTRSLD